MNIYMNICKIKLEKTNLLSKRTKRLTAPGIETLSLKRKKLQEKVNKGDGK